MRNSLVTASAISVRIADLDLDLDLIRIQQSDAAHRIPNASVVPSCGLLSACICLVLYKVTVSNKYVNIGLRLLILCQMHAYCCPCEASSKGMIVINWTVFWALALMQSLRLKQSMSSSSFSSFYHFC